jgi:SAM-dependent methyltransferase
MIPLISKWTAIRERVDQEELLDLNQGSLEDAAQSLRDLTRINRWLGGGAFLRKHLFHRLRSLAPRKPVSILDIGTGSATTPVAIAKWARRNHKTVRIVALDNNARHLKIARQTIAGYPEIELVRSNADALPFREEAFDFVISTLFLHHFTAETLSEIVPLFANVCRGVVLLNDLVRDRVPCLFFRLATPFLARSPLTRHDGRVSLLRAYTRPEMRAILDSADCRQAEIHLDWIYYRMTVVARKVIAGKIVSSEVVPGKASE